MLVFPLAGIVFTISVVLGFHVFGWTSPHKPWVVAGVVCWMFVGTYWLLLWWKSVRWTRDRVAWTLGAVGASALVGVAAGTMCNSIERGFGSFVGSTSCILLWLVATCFIWRERAAERSERLSNTGRDAVVCPTCGYNLTGLKEPRCPECGSQFTLDQLLASQPARAGAELVD
jgi:hypothetical protein